MGGTRRVDFSSVWRTGRLDRFSSRCPLTLLPAIRWPHLVDEAAPLSEPNIDHPAIGLSNEEENQGGRGRGEKGGSNKGSAAASVTIRMNGESYRGHSSSLTTDMHSPCIRIRLCARKHGPLRSRFFTWPTVAAPLQHRCPDFCKYSYSADDERRIK